MVILTILTKSPGIFVPPITRWWFQILFIFTTSWGRCPFWLMFFKRGWNHQPDYDSRHSKKRPFFFANSLRMSHEDAFPRCSLATWGMEVSSLPALPGLERMWCDVSPRGILGSVRLPQHQGVMLKGVLLGKGGCFFCVLGVGWGWIISEVVFLFNGMRVEYVRITCICEHMEGVLTF